MRFTKILAVLTLTLVCFTLTFSEEEAKAKPELGLYPSIQIQGINYIGDTKNADSHKNIDSWYGRFNLYGAFQVKNFASEFLLRYYPSAFGNDFTQTLGKKLDKFQLLIADVKFMSEFIDFKIGRWITCETEGINYGDYIDCDARGSYDSRGWIHNALEVGIKYKDLSYTSILFACEDDAFNSGKLRFYQTLKPIKNFGFEFGYSALVLDRRQDSLAPMHHHVTAQAYYTIIEDLKAYVEFGMIDKRAVKDGPNNTDVPLMFGFTIPTAKFLTRLSAEMEIVLGPNADNYEDQKVLWGVYASKAFKKYVTIDGGVFTDPTPDEKGKLNTNSLGFALRFKSTFK
jgi:hypothetical protein